ncbi:MULTISPECIES: cytochrome c family protein [Ensifer]|uniref:Cytochrome c family protein n=1 Tax=Ensifer adhaerens TaxID=106592 RepID=A0ABY8HER7_ENSAD|nr:MULTISPECIES: cytochrome c family protein [Ensifer]ANK74451.1 cytochrome C [Ensifer adhaerens]KDP70774.1 cytochrome C [Ensifer adhaerens]KQX04708.1 cytochrome C [Ensifer sp. Root423]KQZ51240.1 cytochrome C [Ensifer sp. Root558]MBD9541906.1 cytochrome c family protein [Ensifer sp. ENS04]
MNSYVNMGVGAFLGTVFVLMSVSIASEGIFHSEAPEKEGFTIVAEEGTSEAGAGGAAEVEVDIKPLLLKADASAGETVFKKCASCHTADKGGANKVGPNLWGLVNRPIASHEGFSYSAGMKTFAEGGKVVWDYDHLSYFIEAPKKHVPGTAMGFAGVKKPDERANLIAWLREQADAPAALPDASAGSAEAAPAAGEAAPAAGAEGAKPAEAPATEAKPAEGQPAPAQ